MAKNKFYVVWNGREKGIFTTWAECEKQVKGFQGARFKSFLTKEEAIKAFNGEKSSRSTTSKTQKTKTASAPIVIEENSISVDAACSGNPGIMEYRGVHTTTGEPIFHVGPLFGTNNIGEFLGIVDALRLLQSQGKNTTIYSDSMTALAWVRNKKANSTLARTEKTEKLWTLIEEAEKWLKENTYTNKVLKWDTNKLGEIKADFGRK